MVGLCSEWAGFVLGSVLSVQDQCRWVEHGVGWEGFQAEWAWFVGGWEGLSTDLPSVH